MQITSAKKLAATLAAIVVLGVLANAQSYGTFIPGREGHVMETGNLFKAIAEAKQNKKEQQALADSLTASKAKAITNAQQDEQEKQKLMAEAKKAIDAALKKDDYVEVARLVNANKDLGEEFILYALEETKKADGLDWFASGMWRVSDMVMKITQEGTKLHEDAKKYKTAIETSKP